MAEDDDCEEGKVVGVFIKFGFATSQVSAIFLSVSRIIRTPDIVKASSLVDDGSARLPAHGTLCVWIPYNFTLYKQRYPS